jgi:hypothetical protein
MITSCVELFEILVAVDCYSPKLASYCRAKILFISSSFVSLHAARALPVSSRVTIRGMPALWFVLCEIIVAVDAYSRVVVSNRREETTNGSSSNIFPSVQTAMPESAVLNTKEGKRAGLA